MSGVGQSVFNLLHVNFSRLVNIIFAADLRSKLDGHYDIVLFSFCRLWNRMVKYYSRRPGQLEADSSYRLIVDLTSILLHGLQSGQLPSLCRGKCLAALMQTVNADTSRSTAAAAWMRTTAEATLRELYYESSDKLSSESLSDMCWSFNCCLVGSGHQTGFTTSQRCGILKSLTADKLHCTGMETQGCSEPLRANNNHDVAVTTAANSSDLESTSVVQNASRTVLHGLEGCPSSCVAKSSSEQVCVHQAVSYDVKLVRKLVLLVLRSLDIVTKEPNDQCRSLYSLFAAVV